MKKLIASIGLVAVGTAGLQAAYAPGLNSMETSKMWSVSATLRGFYDDNYATAPSGPSKKGSYGFVVKPSISLNMPLDQTLISLRYAYGLYYYEERDHLGQKPVDQTHEFNLSVDHAFTERWRAKVTDSFVSAQDPSLVSGGTVNRAQGNNIRNVGKVVVNTAWTELFSTEVGYQNTLVDYDQSGTGSYSAKLDRLEHLISLDLLAHLASEAVLYGGYSYGQVNYTANELLDPLFTFRSSSRNSRSHFGYLGVQYNFLDNLTVDARGGVQFVDYYNDPSSSSAVSPYVDIVATYTYLPGSSAKLGFNHSRNSTDVAVTGGKITQDQETSTIYASINHHITPKLLGSIVGQVTYSTFHDGGANDQSEVMYSPGVNLSYTFNPHFSAEVGYNYDKLNSDLVGRDYSRNRVYIGVTATY